MKAVYENDALVLLADPDELMELVLASDEPALLRALERLADPDSLRLVRTEWALGNKPHVRLEAA